MYAVQWWEQVGTGYSWVHIYATHTYILSLSLSLHMHIKLNTQTHTNFTKEVEDVAWHSLHDSITQYHGPCMRIETERLYNQT